MKFKFSLLFALCSLLLALCSLLFACRFNPNVQGTGEKFLQGAWEEDSVRYQDQLLQYTRHNFVFTCDSFYATLITTAKVNEYPDSCFNNGTWTEYAKGVYGVKKDTLYLRGTYTKSNFKQKISGCYHIGEYLPVFIIKKQALGKLLLQDQHSFINLTLKKEITCKPKAL
jgi:hypothetical protein